MEPQPLSFTAQPRNPAHDPPGPHPVDIGNWDQLGTEPLAALQLTGAIDLSTGQRVIDFNGWLSMTKFRLARGEQFRGTPKGSYQAELSDECTVCIRATLTCELDFNDLAREVLRLIAPMHP